MPDKLSKELIAAYERRAAMERALKEIDQRIERLHEALTPFETAQSFEFAEHGPSPEE